MKQAAGRGVGLGHLFDDAVANLGIGQLRKAHGRKPFGLNFKWSEDDKTATMSGEFLVDRTDYDVGSGEWSSGDTIGKNVNVRFDIVMTRK